MTTSVGVSTFTGFHHSNCENGMIYFTMDEDGCLKIGTLPMKQIVRKCFVFQRKKLDHEI